MSGEFTKEIAAAMMHHTIAVVDEAHRYPPGADQKQRQDRVSAAFQRVMDLMDGKPDPVDKATPDTPPPAVSLRTMCETNQGAVLIHISGHRGVGKTVVAAAIEKALTDQGLTVYRENQRDPGRSRVESTRRDTLRKAAHVIIEDHT